MSKLLRLLALASVAAAVAGFRMDTNGNVLRSSPFSPRRHPKVPSPKVSRQTDICTTPECVIAAGDILARMDQSVDPCADFYEFACGTYVATTELEETESKTGTFYEVRDQVDQDSLTIVESDITDEDAESIVKLKDYHTACMDTDTIDSQGYAKFEEILVTDEEAGFPPLVPDWDSSLFSWETVSGDNIRYYMTDGVLSSYVYIDQKDTTRNVIYIDQPSLILPLDVYLNADDFPEYIDAYKAFFVDAVNLIAADMDGVTVDQDELEAAADAVYELEASIAQIVVPAEDRRDLEEMYNPTTLGDLKADYDFVDWGLYFSHSLEGSPGENIDDAEDIINVEPEYFDAAANLIADLDQEALANYLYLRRLLVMANEGPQALNDALFAFDSVLSGQEEPDERWVQCVSKAQSEGKGYAYALGTAYVREFVSADVKPEADALVDNLRVAFSELLEENAWMSDETKPLAQEKLDLMVQLVAYDESIMSNEGLDEFYADDYDINVDTHFDNVARTMDFNMGRYVNVLRDTPDREDWITPAAVVNAFYSPTHNSISFPAGILQPPFFGDGYPRYLNYGAIGVVMGHEITHGFDDQGAQYDGEGNIESWWTEEDQAAFDEHAQCFIDQYSAYTVDEITTPGVDNHINGEQTQGENIADNGGLHESFRAYLDSVEANGEEPRLPGLDQYSPEQTFFISYAQVWCEVQTEESYISQLQSDPHSPGRYRVIGPLSNSEDFATLFDCPVGLMNNGEDRCILW